MPALTIKPVEGISVFYSYIMIFLLLCTYFFVKHGHVTSIFFIRQNILNFDLSDCAPPQFCNIFFRQENHQMRLTE